jgi:diguanylate cyclase (GGDEF)-like protein
MLLAPSPATRPTAYEELQQLIEQEAITTCFQPIVNLRDGSVLGYEALSRGPQGTPLESPGALFPLADEMGLSWELDYTCRRLAIERFARFQNDALLFLNINPHVMQDSRFREGMTKGELASQSIPASRVVLELTERTTVPNMCELYSLLEHYKAQGFRLAIDDAGAGYSGLNLICHVKPRFLKLDMDLIRNIHRDAFKQQLMKFFVDLSRATEISLIAEGIETEAELLTLLDLGLEYGQGFFLSRPEITINTPPPDLVERLQASYRRRLEKRLDHITTLKVGDISCSKESYPSHTPCHQIETLFSKDEALMGIPIVDDGRPVGLVMREKFYTHLGKQYGYSLFHSRSVSAIMDAAPLIVNFQEPIEAVAQAATQRGQVSLYDHIMVTIQDRYYGVVTIMDLLSRITDQGIKYATYSNPLTGLPGNVIIEREIERILNTADHFSILYFDLDNFKAYNDVYGFNRGDEVLKFTAELLQETFNCANFPNAFVGHIGGDDYVVVLDETAPESVLEDFINTFNQKILTYYDEEHIVTGCLNTHNRRGEMDTFPIMSISIAVVTEENGPFRSYHTLAKRTAEIKTRCKTVQGSCYIFDRRKADGPEISLMCCS